MADVPDGLDMIIARPETSLTIAEISEFFDFSTRRTPPSSIFKISNF